MAVQFILGSTGSGKTDLIYKHAINNSKKQGETSILLVP